MPIYEAQAGSPYYAVIDVETTGFRPELGDEIIEIAGQRVLDGKVTQEFQTLVRPVRMPSSESEAVHGISADMLIREGRDMETVMQEFLTFIDGCTLVGHNIPFDLSFINAHLQKLNRPTLTNASLDTCVIARQLLIIPRYTLEHVARYLKVPQPSAHRAMADVETTREVFFKLLERQRARSQR